MGWRGAAGFRQEAEIGRCMMGMRVREAPLEDVVLVRRAPPDRYESSPGPLIREGIGIGMGGGSRRQYRAQRWRHRSRMAETTAAATAKPESEVRSGWFRNGSELRVCVGEKIAVAPKSAAWRMLVWWRSSSGSRAGSVGVASQNRKGAAP